MGALWTVIYRAPGNATWYRSKGYPNQTLAFFLRSQLEQAGYTATVFRVKDVPVHVEYKPVDIAALLADIGPIP
jgi:hypothetical protein